MIQALCTFLLYSAAVVTAVFTNLHMHVVYMDRNAFGIVVCKMDDAKNKFLPYSQPPPIPENTVCTNTSADVADAL